MNKMSKILHKFFQIKLKSTLIILTINMADINLKNLCDSYTFFACIYIYLGLSKDLRCIQFKFDSSQHFSSLLR